MMKFYFARDTVISYPDMGFEDCLIILIKRLAIESSFDTPFCK